MMNGRTTPRGGNLPRIEEPAVRHEHRLQLLIRRLPKAMHDPISRLRQPQARWLRIPAGILLVCGGLLSFLPVLGLWMLPLGLMLLAEDSATLRRARGRALDWIERKRPHWFAYQESTPGSDESRAERVCALEAQK